MAHVINTGAQPVAITLFVLVSQSGIALVGLQPRLIFVGQRVNTGGTVSTVQLIVVVLVDVFPQPPVAVYTIARLCTQPTTVSAFVTAVITGGTLQSSMANTLVGLKFAPGIPAGLQPRLIVLGGLVVKIGTVVSPNHVYTCRHVLVKQPSVAV